MRNGAVKWYSIYCNRLIKTILIVIMGKAFIRARRGYIAPSSPLARLLLIKPQDEGLPAVHLEPEQVDA